MISFIIPARNEERYVADCIRSILRQKISQPFEIIVVNNNSSDATAKAAAAADPSVKVLQESDLGTNPARQRGLDNARGEIAVFLDADVRLPANWVKRILKKLDSSPGIVGVSGPYHFYDFPWYLKVMTIAYNLVITVPWHFFGVRFFGLPSFMVGGNMAIKKSALLAAGGFDTNLKFFGDDTDTGRRLRSVGRVIFSTRTWVYSSARRFKSRGVMRTLALYLWNYFSLLATREPAQKGEYEEIR